MRISIIKVLFVICCIVAAWSAQAQSTRNILWNTAEMGSVAPDSKEGKLIIRNAETILDKPYVNVVNKQKCLSGDVHNYESLAYYAWPNPDDPNGPYISRDGMPSPEYGNYNGVDIKELNYRVRTLMQAYFITLDKRYANYCKEQIKVWFLDKDTRMNPNLDYGQFIPGTNDGKGYPGSISEAYFLMDVMEGVAALRSAKLLNWYTDRKLRKWFSSFEKWLCTSNLGIRMHNVKDNLGIIYDVLLCRMAIYTGNDRIYRNVVDEFETLRLDKHIADDGSQPLELKRSKAMMYSIYNLQHIVDFCYLLDSEGDDYYANHNARIDAAMSFLTQFIGHKEKFQYQELGDWPDLERQLRELQLRVDRLKK